jgi:hypothetical protein
MEKLKKIVSILSIMLVITSSIVIVNQNNESVKATGGQEQQGQGNSIGLDLNYMWQKTEDISNAVHLAYHGQELRKGRLFGSNGTEVYTREYIMNRMNESSLVGVHKIPLWPLADQPLKFYTTFLNVTNFNLHINTPGYPYPRDVPKNESYAAPSACGYYGSRNDLNYNFSGTNIRVLVINESDLFNGGSQKYVPCSPVGGPYETTSGLAAYVADNDPMPTDQFGKVFLMNETQQNINKLNITDDAFGLILIHHPNGYYANSSFLENFSLPVFRIDNSSTVDEVITLIQNGVLIDANNWENKKMMVFAYDSIWPNEDFYDLYKYGPDGIDLRPITGTLRRFSELHQTKCRGVIVYSDKTDETHPTFVYSYKWVRYPLRITWLPVFSVNNSIGEFLLNHLSSADTMNYFEQQELLNEVHGTGETAGVKAYDVVGHLNITHSPNDEIVILTNRHDSMVGECPGDSGTGGAMVLTIAKFFHDHPEIKRKYNLTFLQTTGEEFGFKGAQYYSDSHPGDHIILCIGFEQLGMKAPADDTTITVNSNTNKKITGEIAKQTNYEQRTGHQYHFMGARTFQYLLLKNLFLGDLSEGTVWAQRGRFDVNYSTWPTDTIWIGKEVFPLHHQTGKNFTLGDSLLNEDRNDCNVTLEMAWNYTKYYIVNPDCNFTGTVSYTSTDADQDGLKDTIQAILPMKSDLPQDLVRVKAYLKKEGKLFPRAVVDQDFIITNRTQNYAMNIALPPYCSPGYYNATLYLYNSTNRINDIINLPYYANASCPPSLFFYLYPRGNEPPTTPSKPVGNNTLEVGQQGSWSSTTSDPNHDLVAEQWYSNWSTVPSIYVKFHDTGLYNPDSTTPTVSRTFHATGAHYIKVRAYDQYSGLLHPYMSDFSDFFKVNVTANPKINNPQEQLHQNQGNLLHLVQGTTVLYGSQTGAASPTWDWSTQDQSRGHYSSQNASAQYTSQGTHYYNVTLNVTDSQTHLTGSDTLRVRVSPLDSDFNTSYFHGAAPYTTISFRNVSKAMAGNHITDCTWDFGDGTVSYQSSVNHTFLEEGDFNVTLTVKDSQNNIDTDYCLVHIVSEPRPPEIPEVQSPDVITNASDATILAVVDPTDRNLSSVKVQITTPNNTTGNYTMTNLCDDVYMFTLNNSSVVGLYNFTVWATDTENNINSSNGSYYLLLPVLSYVPPTPDDGACVNHSWVKVNVSVNDTCSTSAFIDWNRTLHGYWPMDVYNDTCIYDGSTYQNDGMFHNGMNASSITTGKYGKGLQFDGADDYVDLGNDTSLNLGTGDFTFMVWEKSHASSYANTTVILGNQPENANWDGYVCGVKNTPYFYTVQNGQTTSINGFHDVTDNTWHHLVYVRKGGNLSLYVDTAFDTGRTGTVRNITNNKHTCFSYENRADWYHFDGVLDEAQLYSRALGRDEINASYNNGLYRLCHNFTGLADGTYEYYAHAIDVNGSQGAAEIRQVTVDTVAPTISTVSASPSPVGFGFNVTINTNVTDTGTGVKNVSATITYPVGISNNPVTVPMTHISGTMYRYVFSDTWHTGRYNYTIIASDNASNTRTSGGHSFNVSASATMSIATLKDIYGANQYINITDPPNPPENLTVVGRGLTWSTYYNSSSGCNMLESFQGPVNYQADNGSWTPINNTLTALPSNHPAYSFGYRAGNNRGLFGAFFKPDVSSDWPVAFTYNRSNNPTMSVIRSKLVGVGYVDPKSNWSYHYLQNVQGSQGQFTGDTATYHGVFTGTDVTWSYDNAGLKEAITMNNTTRTALQNHPPSLYGLNDSTSYLVFITKLEYLNLNMYNNSGALTGNVTISDTGVDLKDASGVFKCGLPLGDAYELCNESVRQKLTYRIVHLNGNTYLFSGIRVPDLAAMTFPVVIDPTLTVYSTSSDGYIYKSDTNYTRGQSATTGTVNSSGQFLTIGQKKDQSIPPNYYVYRGYVFFNTSSLPSNAYLDSATLSLYKKDDYSTTDFSITIQHSEAGGGAYPHSPLQSVDYNKIYYTGNGGTYNTSGFHSGYNNISLTQLGWIVKGGTTKFCLRSSRDINANSPTGNEYVNVYANEKGSGYQPKLVVVYRNQSKIKNTWSTAIKGYLSIQIQYYNSTQGKWLVEKDTINETSPRTINGYAQLALDTIFNGHVRTNDLHHNSSIYRTYTAFRDPYQNILKTNDGKQMVAWWQFTTNVGS